MATATITKVAAETYMENGVFIVTLNLKVNDGVSDIIDQDYSQIFNKRKNDTVAKVKERFRSQMQASIDEYNDPITPPSDSKIATAISEIENSLVL